MQRLFVFAILFTVMLATPAVVARAHAFPEHQVPGAGAELDHSPTAVTIRFDRVLESAFSSLRVEDDAGKRVDANDSHAVSGGSDTLEVALEPLASGRYHVFWTAVALDGHRTHGDYTFTVRKGSAP